MRWGLLLVFLGGCVPVDYRILQKRLATVTAEKNDLSKNLMVCEEKNKRLKQTAQDNPAGSPKASIGEKELEAIKRKALAEAELKYKARINRAKN